MWRLRALSQIARRFPAWARSVWDETRRRTEFQRVERLDHYLDDNG